MCHVRGFGAFTNVRSASIFKTPQVCGWRQCLMPGTTTKQHKTKHNIYNNRKKSATYRVFRKKGLRWQGGPPFFAKFPKFSGLYSAVLLRGWNRRCSPTRSWRTACSDAVELWSRSGGAVESAAAGIRVSFLDRLFSGL